MQVSASREEPSLRYYERFAVPDESLSEKMRSSTLGVSRPRTRNAFQLLESFKRRLCVGALTRREAAVRIFSLRREVTSRGDNFQERRLRRSVSTFSDLVRFSQSFPPRNQRARHARASRTLKNQFHPASNVGNVALSQIRMSRRERMLVHAALKLELLAGVISVKSTKMPRLSSAGFVFDPNVGCDCIRFR